MTLYVILYVDHESRKAEWGWRRGGCWKAKRILITYGLTGKVERGS